MAPLLLLLLVVALPALGSVGPPPISPPIVTCVAEDTVCAVIDFRAGRTAVLRFEPGQAHLLWSASHVAPVVFLSPDGRFAVFVVSAEWHFTKPKPNRVVISFWSAAGISSTVRMRDLFANGMQPPEAGASGEFLGFTSAGAFSIRVLGQGVVTFDPATGKRL